LPTIYAKRNRFNWLLFIILSVIWGSSFILMKESTQDLNGWQIGAIRIFSAGIIFLPFAVFHIKDIPLRRLPLIVISAILGTSSFVLIRHRHRKKINSSMAAILNSLTPLLVILIGFCSFMLNFNRKRQRGYW
jgi:drug/metabolite transporter (DMT)-like permease